ncbi:MAG: hypothetical protein DRI90_18050 [Deltaproteobacteria bacterium]|nr:MAG: hypothetical protein DRI90_18050 [Deltaproteobacteria bacterium]
MTGTGKPKSIGDDQVVHSLEGHGPDVVIGPKSAAEPDTVSTDGSGTAAAELTEDEAAMRLTDPADPPFIPVTTEKGAAKTKLKPVLIARPSKEAEPAPTQEDPGDREVVAVEPDALAGEGKDCGPGRLVPVAIASVVAFAAGLAVGRATAPRAAPAVSGDAATMSAAAPAHRAATATPSAPDSGATRARPPTGTPKPAPTKKWSPDDI